MPLTLKEMRERFRRQVSYVIASVLILLTRK
jgi:hypothetical protein